MFLIDLNNVLVQVSLSSIMINLQLIWQRYTLPKQIEECPLETLCKKLASTLLEELNKDKIAYHSLVRSIWNKLPESIKDSKNLISFKHNLKDHFLKDLEGREINVFAF